MNRTELLIVMVSFVFLTNVFAEELKTSKQINATRATESSEGNLSIASNDFSIETNVNSIFEVTSQNLSNGIIGYDYYSIIHTNGGMAPILFSFPEPEMVPQGLYLSSAGEVYGVPSEAGQFNFQVKAVDSNGESVECIISITINYPEDAVRVELFSDIVEGLQIYSLGEIVNITAQVYGTGQADVYFIIFYPDGNYKSVTLDGFSSANAKIALVEDWEIESDVYSILNHAFEDPGLYMFYIIFNTPNSDIFNENNWIAYDSIFVDVKSADDDVVPFIPDIFANVPTFPITPIDISPTPPFNTEIRNFNLPTVGFWDRFWLNNWFWDWENYWDNFWDRFWDWLWDLV